ncbi:C40 family peptidase [Streptomyces sp. NPDC054961]
MKMMQNYEGAPLLNVGGSGVGSQALRRAAARIGTPYAYGGGSPAGPGRGFCDDGNGYVRGRCADSSTVGFDCSSLVQCAYWPHTQLPRTAAAQYEATAHRPVSRGELRPGDLLFWPTGTGPSTTSADGLIPVRSPDLVGLGQERAPRLRACAGPGVGGGRSRARLGRAAQERAAAHRLGRALHPR